MYFYSLLFFQCFNPCVPASEPALGQQQLHPAPVHQKGEDKSKSPVKIGIHQAAVLLLLFVQAVNCQEYFGIQLISISRWSLKGTWNFCGVKPLF